MALLLRAAAESSLTVLKEVAEYNLHPREEAVGRRVAKRSYKARPVGSGAGACAEVHGFYQMTPRGALSPADERRRSASPPSLRPGTPEQRRPESPTLALIRRNSAPALERMRKVSPARVVRRAVSLVVAVPDAVRYHVTGRIPPETSAFKPPESALHPSSSSVAPATMAAAEEGPPPPKAKAARPKVKLDFELNRHAAALAHVTGLTRRHLTKLWTLYMAIDEDLSGEIDYAELCLFFNVTRSTFVDAIFELADVNESGQLDFNEFVAVVCMYSCFTRDDILKLCFATFDVDNSDFIDEDEFVELTRVISSGDPTFPGSFAKCLEQFDKNDDGEISFTEFREIHRIFPMLLFPAFQMQDLIWRKTFGMTEWGRLKAEIVRREEIEQYMKEHDGAMPTPTLLELVLMPLRSIWTPYVQSSAEAANAATGGVEALAEQNDE